MGLEVGWIKLVPAGLMRKDSVTEDEKYSNKAYLKKKKLIGSNRLGQVF